MQALGVGLASLMGVGGGKYLYGSGQANRNASSSGASSSRQQPTILTVAPQNSSGIGLSHLLFAGALGAGAVMVLGGLQWIRREDAAKRITPHIKKLESKALKQIRNADLNSADRDQKLNRNSKIRLQKMTSEIVGENRGNFEMLSQQIHCLTQIALTTLTTMAKPTTPGGEGMEEDVERQRQKILGFAREAQLESDRCVDLERVNKARKFHVSTLRAEIPGLEIPGGGGELKEEEPISTGPHDLDQKRERPTKKKTAQYKTAGLYTMGSLVLLSSLYFIFSSGSPSSKPGH